MFIDPGSMDKGTSAKLDPVPWPSSHSGHKHYRLGGIQRMHLNMCLKKGMDKVQFGVSSIQAQTSVNYRGGWHDQICAGFFLDRYGMGLHLLDKEKPVKPWAKLTLDLLLCNRGLVFSI